MRKKYNRPIVNRHQINVDRNMGRVERPVYTVVPADDSAVFDEDDVQAICCYRESMGRHHRQRWQKPITNLARHHEDWPFIPSLLMNRKPFVLPKNGRNQ